MVADLDCLGVAVGHDGEHMHGVSVLHIGDAIAAGGDDGAVIDRVRPLEAVLALHLERGGADRGDLTDLAGQRLVAAIRTWHGELTVDPGTESAPTMALEPESGTRTRSARCRRGWRRLGRIRGWRLRRAGIRGLLGRQPGRRRAGQRGDADGEADGESQAGGYNR